MSVGKQQQKQKSVYLNELRSVSPVSLTLHWGSFWSSHSALYVRDGYGNDTFMQSGPSLFCLPLRRPAISLTRARSHLVVTLSVFLRCDLKRGRQSVSVGISEEQRRGEGIGREMKGGIVHIRAAWGSSRGTVWLSFQHQER